MQFSALHARPPRAEGRIKWPPRWARQGRVATPDPRAKQLITAAIRWTNAKNFSMSMVGYTTAGPQSAAGPSNKPFLPDAELD